MANLILDWKTQGKLQRKEIVIGGRQAKRQEWQLNKSRFLILITFKTYPPTWKDYGKIQAEGPSNILPILNEMIKSFKFTELLIKVYFEERGTDDCSIVQESTRTIPYTQAVTTAAIQAMLEGPTQQEMQTVSQAIPVGTRLKSLEIENNIAYANFSKELQNYGGGSCNALAIRAQIESTLKQFPTVKDIVISVEGEIEDILQP